MATQALTVREESQGIAPAANRASLITDVQRLGGLLAASGYFADAREMAQAAVKVLAGEELGIPPVAAMMGINIIKGKVALSGNLIASRIRAHGYDYRHKQFDNKGCCLEFLSKAVDGKRTVLGESSFDEDDAKNAGCFGDMYKKWPRNMYFNRAISNGAKWYTPEVFAGAPVYVPEELGATVDEQGDMVHPETTPTERQQEVASRKIAEMKAGKSYAEVSTRDERQRPESPAFGYEHANQIPTLNTARDIWPESPADGMIPPGQDTPPVVETLESQIKARLAQFAAMKGDIGKDQYYRILGAFGYEHANQIPTLNTARDIWREMAAVRAETPKTTPAEAQ